MILNNLNMRILANIVETIENVFCSLAPKLFKSGIVWFQTLLNI